MNSKQRVLAAINHEQPDRVPLGYGAWQAVSEALCAYLGVDPACRWTHWQEYPEALLQRLGVDLRIVRARPLAASPKAADGTWVDIWGVPQSRDNYPTAHPLAGAASVAEIEAYPWPDPEAFDYEGYAEECERFEAYAVCGGDWSPFFFIALELMGTEPFMISLHTQPEVAQALLRHIADYYLATTQRMFEAARRADGSSRLDIFFMGDDYGTQRGPFMSPRDFRKFILPELRRFYELARSYDLKIMQHSCGSVRAVLPDLIDLGLQVLDPIQVRAAGMDIAGLRRDFGGRLAFHGSIDTQHTLPHGTVADVQAEVRARLAGFAGGGGLILAGSQDYIDDIPLANIVAIYDTVCETA